MVTRVLIGINVAVFILQWMSGYPENRNSLFLKLDEWGPAISYGQWWVIFTSAFMHASIMHIGFNMLALYQVGSIVEQLVGGWRLLIIYVIALLGAAFAVFQFNYWQHTLGASGAVFGIFGALVAFGLRLGQVGRQLIQSVLGVIILNLIIGFANPSISNAAHIGGLITGFIAGLVFGPTLMRVRTAPPQ